MKCEEGVKQPRRATTGSIGYDFYAPFDILLDPKIWITIKTGVYLTDDDLVKGRAEWAMFLLPRSGQGSRQGVKLRNTVGVIDCDYRGEILATMRCELEPFRIKKGEAFMQGIIIPRFTLDNEIKPTALRDGGFGSTDGGKSNEE